MTGTFLERRATCTIPLSTEIRRTGNLSVGNLFDTKSIVNTCINSTRKSNVWNFQFVYRMCSTVVLNLFIDQFYRTQL